MASANIRGHRRLELSAHPPFPPSRDDPAARSPRGSNDDNSQRNRPIHEEQPASLGYDTRNQQLPDTMTDPIPAPEVLPPKNDAAPPPPPPDNARQLKTPPPAHTSPGRSRAPNAWATELGARVLPIIEPKWQRGPARRRRRTPKLHDRARSVPAWVRTGGTEDGRRRHHQDSRRPSFSRDDGEKSRPTTAQDHTPQRDEDGLAVPADHADTMGRREVQPPAPVHERTGEPRAVPDQEEQDGLEKGYEDQDQDGQISATDQRKEKPPYRISRWRQLAGPNHLRRHRARRGDDRLVDIDWLNRVIGDYSQPWSGPTTSKIKRRRRGFGGAVKYVFLYSPMLPLFIRLVVFAFSVVALGLGGSIQHLTSKSNNPRRSTSAVMAIVVDSIALVYLAYIAYDEFRGKPLGLRSPLAKMRLILLDLVFIVFDAVNLGIAFVGLTNVEGPCKSVEINNVFNGNDGAICRRQKGLAAVLLVALFAWVATFAISVFRLVERVTATSRRKHTAEAPKLEA